MQIKELILVEVNLNKINQPLLNLAITNKMKGIYFLYDKELNLIYIGKTSNLRQRLLAHISPRNNSRKEESDKYDFYGYSSILPLGIVKYYSFIEIEDVKERTLRELILIQLLNPKYNYIGIKDEIVNKLKR